MRFFAHPDGSFLVAIIRDEHPEDPREFFKHLGHMHCFSRKYKLGDPHEWRSFNELAKHVTKQGIIALPLYLLDHSGLSMNTSGFEDCDPLGWDWGLVGYIWTTRDEAKAWFGRKRWSKSLLRKTVDLLEAEVREYDSYLRGDVFALAVYTCPHEEPEEVISGFYGEDQAEAGVREIFYERLGVASGVIELYPDSVPTCPGCGEPMDELEVTYGTYGWATWKDGHWEEAYDQYSEGTEYRCGFCGEDVTVLVSLQGLVRRISSEAHQP